MPDAYQNENDHRGQGCGKHLFQVLIGNLAFSLMARTFRNFSLRQTAILFDGTLCGYGLDYKNIRLMYLGIALLIAVDILHERKVKLRETVLRQDIVTRFAIYLLAVFAIIIFGIYGPEFSASSFIYQEF